MDIVAELFAGLPRQGPGSNACTRKALALLPPFQKTPTILDAACGTGLPSVQLAHQTRGRVHAVDTHKPFLDQLRIYAQLTSLSDRVNTHLASMETLKFEKGHFDLLWCEGSIHLIGFKKGLSYWRDFLKKGGYACVSELTWLTPDPPEEPKRYWKKKYPAMTDIRGNLKLIEEAGYKPLDKFILPDMDWWENYYGPMEKRIAELRGQYSADPDALQELKTQQQEIDLFKNYANTYGSVFYAMQRA